MAIRRTTLREFRAYIKGINNAVLRGHGLALIEVGQNARKLAIQNLKDNFKETSAARTETGRRLTGNLLKAVKVEFQMSPSSLPKAELVVKGVPYAAAQEYGSTHGPKRAKHLWVKVDYKTPFKRLTPTEFINRKRAGSQKRVSYSIFRSKKGNLIAAKVRRFKTREPEIRTLFVLKDEVTIPERPYLRPAAKEAAAGYHKLAKKHIAKAMRRRKRFT